jgi:hypothetical protein
VGILAQHPPSKRWRFCLFALIRGSQERHDAITSRRDSAATHVARTLVAGHIIVAAKRFVYILKSLKTPVT